MQTKTLLVFFLLFVTFVKAQIYTPSGVIQGTSGNNFVGIGTNAPLHKLNVNGIHTDSRILLHSAGNNTDAGQADLMLWASEPGLTYNGVGIGNNISNYTTTSGGLKLLNAARGGSYMRLLDNAISFNVLSASGIDKQAISINSIGNVGIGVASPTASLDINSPSVVGAETVLKLKVSDAAQDYIRIINGTNSDGQFIPALNGYHVSDNRASLYLTATTETNMDTGTDPLMAFDSRTTSASVVTRPLFSWESYGNKKMILTSNGSLGIGTTTTGTHKLAVEGSIGAREIKVQATGWSDFVFKKSYDLPTLEEVEKHINEKGHLKDIPSEEEVLKNGINLGEMNSKLLQKIEELTLYTIEQQKNTEKLTKVIETLTKRLEVVEKK